MQVCTLLQTDNHASTSPLIFTGRMPFLPPNQLRQSTEGMYCSTTSGVLMAIGCVASCRQNLSYDFTLMAVLKTLCRVSLECLEKNQNFAGPVVPKNQCHFSSFRTSTGLIFFPFFQDPWESCYEYLYKSVITWLPMTSPISLILKHEDMYFALTQCVRYLYEMIGMLL